MFKQKEKDPEPGAPMWVLSYGDMVTNLLTFFVLLVAFSSTQEAKFKEAMDSLQQYLGVLPEREAGILPGEYLPRELTLKIHASNLKDEADQKEKMKESYSVALKQSGNKKGSGGTNIEIEETLNMLRIRIPSSTLFEIGKVKFNETSLDVLDNIISLIRDIPDKVEVEGHTDNIPIFSDKYASNWELSGARSLSIVEYFINKGIAPTRLSAVACGEFRPIADNNTPEGRAKNRRVEIVIGRMRDPKNER